MRNPVWFCERPTEVWFTHYKFQYALFVESVAGLEMVLSLMEPCCQGIFNSLKFYFYFSICWSTFCYSGWSLITAPTLIYRALMATTAWVTRPSRPLEQVSLSVSGRASPCPSGFGVLSQSVVPAFVFIVLSGSYLVHMSLFTTFFFGAYISFKALVISPHSTILSSLMVRSRF